MEPRKAKVKEDKSLFNTLFDQHGKVRLRNEEDPKPLTETKVKSQKKISDESVAQKMKEIEEKVNADIEEEEAELRAAVFSPPKNPLMLDIVKDLIETTREIDEETLRQNPNPSNKVLAGIIERQQKNIRYQLSQNLEQKSITNDPVESNEKTSLTFKQESIDSDSTTFNNTISRKKRC